MEQPRIAGAPGRTFSGAFHDYVRGVFADQSARSRLLRARRVRWLQRLAQRSAPGAEQRWEGEGGSTR
jgi:hypothetical protein